MKIKARFENYYSEGYMPWVHSKPDFNLVEMVEKWPVKPCKTLEIGCGTGTDAIWLARQGFNVTAIDAVDVPIKLAKEKIENENLDCKFLVKDFFKDSIAGGPFQFIFDRGYFHSYRTKKGRKKLAQTVHNNLSDDGIWITLVGSCDSPPRETGPPMQSAKNIVDAVEEFFEIRLLKSSVFGSESEVPAKIWVGVFSKRIT